MASPCPAATQAVSNGVWQGDIPTHFALPLLIIQLSLVVLLTRSLAWLLKPLKQPRVIAEIIGGVILGPSALGRFHPYSQKIFPKQSLTIIDTVANIGLLFFLFIVGLELDLNEIRRTGKRAFLIAMAGICVPFFAGIGVCILVRSTISQGVKFAPLVVFMGVPISITAFPVLVRILAEHKLLTTDVGQIVLPAAAINDVCAWILLAVGVALAGSNDSPLTPAWVLLCGIVFVIFMFIITRRLMSWVVRRVNSQESASEIYVCITLMGVLISGFTTDAIGIHPLFGAFVFGMVIPKEGPFAEVLTEKIEDFVTILMLPLFFASSGLKTNLGTINSAASFGYLILIFVTAAGGKICATWGVLLARGTGQRKALCMGFLMNTKGLVELIILNIGRDVKVLNDQTFAILVLMCLITTFITTPIVMALYKPSAATIPYIARNLTQMSPKVELRILACIHGSRTIPPIIDLLDVARGSGKQSMKAYILHLVELSERRSSLMVAKRVTAKLRYPKFSGSRQARDEIFVAFESYGQLNKVAVKPVTVVSEMEDMYQDVCRIAAEARASFIILPFHKCYRGDGELEIINPLLRKVNQKVLQYAPCSVGIIMDGGSHEMTWSATTPRRMALLFFGGPDDREAVEVGCRMAEHRGVSLTLIRLLPGAEMESTVVNLVPLSDANEKAERDDVYHFSTALVDVEKERGLDDECIAEARKQQVSYTQQVTNNAIEAVIGIARSNKYSMFVVGRGRHPASSLIATLADASPAECSELGPVADALLAAEQVAAHYSMLVVQQYDSRLTEEGPFRKVALNMERGKT